MRVTIVLLSPESTGFNVCQTSNITPPIGLESHLDEFGILLLVKSVH
jgi:hypothetical protein